MTLPTRGNRIRPTRPFTAWLPPVAAIALIALFLALASWQLERAAEKEATAALFEQEAPVSDYDTRADYRLYQPVRTSGRYLAERQFLIDNIVREQRLGYYVITPFEFAVGEPLLLVNRGFVPRPEHGGLPDIHVDDDERQVTGRIGRLPRVGLRPDVAITPGQEWPRLAVYPELADVAESLDRPLADHVLLLEPSTDDGYLRDWRPQQKGPLMHYGYAFQWSALALTVFVILAWQLRKRFRHD